jgi:hypothetical protein
MTHLAHGWHCCPVYYYWQQMLKLRIITPTSAAAASGTLVTEIANESCTCSDTSCILAHITTTKYTTKIVHLYGTGTEYHKTALSYKGT